MSYKYTPNLRCHSEWHCQTLPEKDIWDFLGQFQTYLVETINSFGIVKKFSIQMDNGHGLSLKFCFWTFSTQNFDPRYYLSPLDHGDHGSILQKWVVVKEDKVLQTLV